MSWEKEADALSALGLMVSKIRIGLVLTQKGGVLGPEDSYIFRLRGFVCWKQVQSWIHITIWCKCLWLSWRSSGKESITGEPESRRSKDFAKTLAQVLRRPFFLPPVPALCIRAHGEMGVLVFNSQMVSAQKVMDKGFLFRYPNLKAMKSLQLIKYFRTLLQKTSRYSWLSCLRDSFILNFQWSNHVWRFHLLS